MLDCKPNPEIWKRVNDVIIGENSAEVVITLIGGISSILIDSGATDARAARVHLAAMLLSPDDGPVGSLLPELEAEFRKLRGARTVHVLRSGFALCGFSLELPHAWPDGHFWCDLEDWAEQASCQECRAAARSRKP